MATSLAEIRAKLQAQENRKNNASGNMDNSIFPHWNIPDGVESTLRFLPDGDPNNSFFWVERLMIKLPFPGIKGQAESKPCVVQVPCVEMYGKDYVCPILTEVRPWYKDKTLEPLANKYWKKRSYYFHGFVRKNSLVDDNPPANPIRRFIISPQIFTLIKAALMDPELNNLPTDYDSGIDFRVVKSKGKSGYSEYNTSSWSRNSSALTAAERQAIETYGLTNLSSFLPKIPGEVELKVMKEMFDASVDGQEYDMERWGQYFKPNGVFVESQSSDEETSEAAPVQPTAPVLAKQENSAPAPVTEQAPSNTSNVKRADDILNMIRNRANKPAA
jgi:hypothetical protein